MINPRCISPDRATSSSMPSAFVRVCRDRARPRFAKQIVDLANTNGFYPVRCQNVEQSVSRRIEREILPVRGADVRALSSHKRSCDNAPHRSCTHTHLITGLPADPVELLEGNDLFVCCNLEDRVGRGVHDGLPRPHMLCPEFLNDGRSGGRLVAKKPCASGDREEPVHQLRREPLRIRG